jgi:hypothetical protein
MHQPTHSTFLKNAINYSKQLNNNNTNDK